MLILSTPLKYDNTHHLTLFTGLNKITETDCLLQFPIYYHHSYNRDTYIYMTACHVKLEDPNVQCGSMKHLSGKYPPAEVPLLKLVQPLVGPVNMFTVTRLWRA